MYNWDTQHNKTTELLLRAVSFFGFDIESNGSVGTLAVPGELIQNGTDVNDVICM